MKYEGDWLHIDSPEKLAEYAKAVANGQIDYPVFVVGPGGTGKTEIFRQHIPDFVEDDPDHLKNKKKYAHWMEGTISPVQFYIAIARHKDRTLVADDCPELQKNATLRALLKQLCNTKNPRKVVYDKAAVAGSPIEQAQVDTTTITSSTFVLIANEWSTIGPDIQAVNSRAKLVRYAPSIPTRLKYAEGWIGDKEILRFLHESYKKGMIRRLHFRHLRHAQDFKKSGIENWKEYLRRMFEPAEIADLDDESTVIVRWAERNTDCGVFTAAQVHANVRSFRGRRAELDKAISHLLQTGLIHELPKPPRQKGDRTRIPSAVFALGPDDKKAQTKTKVTNVTRKPKKRG